MLPVTVLAACGQAQVRPFRAESANRLQGALLAALPVFAALQLPWALAVTLGLRLDGDDDDDALQYISSRCADFSLVLLCLPCLWAAHATYAWATATKRPSLARTRPRQELRGR